MATGYRHDREAIINRARCSIVLFLEEQSEITKEGGRWRGGGGISFRCTGITIARSEMINYR